MFTPEANIDVELLLKCANKDQYVAEIHLHRHDEASDAVLANDRPVILHLEQLLSLYLEPRRYGEALTNMIFSDTKLREAWALVKGYGVGTRVPIRLRLRLEPAVEHLHTLRWELLQDPVDKRILCRNEQILFSRHISTSDVEGFNVECSAPELLAVVANPTDIADYGLSSINVAENLECLQSSFPEERIKVLAQGSGSKPATRAALFAALSKGCAVLYLVCHGTINENQPILWLERADGTSERLNASELTEYIGSLSASRRPKLVVLLSCRSAGNEQPDMVQIAIAPRLARAGVGAVLGLQSDAPIGMVSRLMSSFMETLVQTREVDRALAIARAQLSDDDPWWMPTLFMRLRDGIIWPVVQSAVPTANQVTVPRVASPDDVIGDKASSSKINLKQFASLLQIDVDTGLMRVHENQHNQWDSLVDQLKSADLDVNKAPLIYTEAAVWSDHKPINLWERNLTALDLFRNILQKRYEQRPQDILTMLVFVETLARHQDVSFHTKSRLRLWCEQVVFTLFRGTADEISYKDQIDRRSVQHALIAAQYTAAYFSLVVAIQTVPGEFDRFHVWFRLLHPSGLEFNPFNNMRSEYTANEVAVEFARTLREIPSWIRLGKSGFVVEFMLSDDLLTQAEMQDIKWKFTNWRVPVEVRRRLSDQELGNLYPVLIRCLNRTEDEIEIWSQRWAWFKQYRDDVSFEELPLLTCLTLDHADYISPEEWGQQKHLVGVVFDNLSDISVLWEQGLLDAMLGAGLPIAIWPTAPKNVSTQDYLRSLLDPHFKDLWRLPQALWETRRAMGQSSTVDGVVLFWDDYDRQPKQVPLQAPK